MLSSEIIAFSAFAWIGSFTPGPNVAIAATTGVNHGFRATLPHVIGVPLGFVTMMWLLGIGGSALLQEQPELIWLMKIAGNTYLLYLAWGLCSSGSLAEKQVPKPFSIPQSAMFQAINPKAWMMLVAALSSYAIGYADFWQRLVWMSFGFALPSALSLLAWAYMGDKLSHYLKVGKRLRIFNVCMGISLAITAIWMMQLN